MSILWAILVLSVVLVPATGGALGELSLSPVPVILWHGMGDTCCAGILVVKERIEAVLPGVFVHSISASLGRPIVSRSDSASQWWARRWTATSGLVSSAE